MTKYKFSDEELAQAVAVSKTVTDTMRRLGFTKIAGGSACHIKQRILRCNIDISHFDPYAYKKKQTTWNKKSASEILVEENREYRPSARLLKRAMLEIGIDCKCSECGVKEIYNNKPLVLHIDHIDGNWSNNKPENLRFLCPNCHSQTKTFGNKKRS